MTEMSPAEEVFFAALAKPPADRAAYLDAACAGRPELRARVEKLLAAHPKVGDFLEPGPAATAPFGDGHPTADPAGTADAPTTPPTTAGAVIAGRYKLLQPIGEGGMGTVWMADQTEPVKRRVAVKLIRVERSTSATILARFAAERQAIALMDHPHIAKLLDAGTTADGQPFFVMELVKGVPLAEFCDAHKLTIPDRLALFGQVCGAVQHAHQKGVIHRDLKPTNILVESHDGKPVPKVIDFGLAKATTGLQLSEHTLFTAFGSVMGTPLYMAPEQATFNAIDVDTRADIYALGVILYELLTGTTPLTREAIKKAALDEMLRLVREQEAPTPSSRLSTAEGTPSVAANRQTEPAKLGRFVKGELDWIVLKALAKDRDRRYETANGFAKDVERFLAHEPVTAGPPTAAYRLRKFVQRNRPQLTAAGLVALALVVGAVGTVVGLIEARRQRDAAESARLDEAREKDRAVAAEKLAGNRLAEVIAEKQRADEERAVAGVVNDFLLKDLLALADPEHNPNRELTVRAALDRAAVAIDRRFRDRPRIEAAVRRTVGEAYFGLGEYAVARGHLDRAVELARRALGPDHPDTLAAEVSLGWAYYFLGDRGRATDLFERAATVAACLLPAGHPTALLAANSTAYLAMSQGHYDRAERLLTEALAAGRRTQGPDGEDVTALEFRLATLYMTTRRYADAELLFRACLAASRRDHGGDHIKTLDLMVGLASLYWSTGRYADAEGLYRELLAGRRRVLGPEHQQTLMAMRMLAGNRMSQERYAEAEELYAALSEVERRLKGPNDPARRSVLRQLGSARYWRGAIGGAEEAYREAVELGRRVGVKDAEAGHAALGLGDCHLAQYRYVDAEAVYRTAVAVLDVAETSGIARFVARSQLGESLRRQAKDAEAGPLLVAGYEGMKAREKAIPPQASTRLPESLDRLVELAAATNKPAEAAKWRAERAKYPFVAPPPRPAK